MRFDCLYVYNIQLRHFVEKKKKQQQHKTTYKTYQTYIVIYPHTTYSL